MSEYSQYTCGICQESALLNINNTCSFCQEPICDECIGYLINEFYCCSECMLIAKQEEHKIDYN